MLKGWQSHSTCIVRNPSHLLPGAALLAAGDQVQKSNAKIAEGASSGLDQLISDAGKQAKGAGAPGFALPACVQRQSGWIAGRGRAARDRSNVWNLQGQPPPAPRGMLGRQPRQLLLTPR